MMNSSPALSRILEPVHPSPVSNSPAMEEIASSLRASNSASPNVATPPNATPHITLDARSTSTLSAPTSAPGSVPRLRSSIACVKCRKSKIKCTNSGTGTTCEACAHSGRECVYPVSGSGGAKRDGDGEDSDRAKRTRVRRPDPIQDGAKLGFPLKYSSPDYARVRFASDKESSQSSGRPSSWQPSALSESMWNDVFQLFQLHHGTELAFLHAPTFLPFLTETSPSDPLSQHLLQLGILALTARHHDGLIYQFSSQLSNGSAPSRASDMVCEHFAHTLKGLLLGGEKTPAAASIEEPTLAKIQAFLMLSLYEWSSRRGMQAWLYLGMAIRIAQAMDLFSEDVEVPDTISNPLTGSLISMLSKITIHSERQDLESSETFVQEEATRRTVWSCFLLDRYLSNGISRSTSMDAEKIRVQMPCGEKGWTFGERACTPFFNGNCSQQKERTKRRLRYAKKQNNDRGGAIDPRVVHAGAENSTNRITCEYGQDEGLISRYIKLVDIWGAIARYSYDGGSRAAGSPTPWDDRSKHWMLKGELQKFMDQMPRSYRFTKANSQAHLTQHTWSSYTLLHALYSVCRLVLLREFLPFVPVGLRSTTHLDEVEIRNPNVYSRTWYSGALAELFQVAHDLMELLQTCKARSSLPAGPIVGFSVYLVSLIGIYALYFPNMDSKGLVFGKDLDAQTAMERQNRIVETVSMLASMQAHLPMAEHWVRTLHRAHRYYQQLYASWAPEMRFGAAGIYTLPGTTESANRPWQTRLDAIFQEFGAFEDEETVFTLPVSEALLLAKGTAERLAPSPQLAWKPINSGQRVGRCIDPLDRPAPQLGPQPHAKWYQARGDPRSDQAPTSTEQNGTNYSAPPPPNTLPPITAPSMNLHSSYPPAAPAKPQVHTQTLLSFTGEDVAIFIDAKTNKDLAALKAGWALLADDKDPTTNIGSPSLRAQEIKKMEAFGVSWFGVLWQW